MDYSAPFIKQNTVFIIKNISNPPKVVNIFQYPTMPGTTRDLLMIPGVSEANIRASLLKGEVNHKLRAKDITIIQSDIDLLQFNMDQKTFLMAAGITQGIDITDSNLQVLREENIVLIGIIDGVNLIFTTPDIFIQDGHQIAVYLNGVRQIISQDYMVAESGGPGTGYNTVIFTIPPKPLPLPTDIVTADYYILQK